MKINSLKISNILSFKHIEDFDFADNTIDFKKEINVLIGPNGSGKSNLIEIINKLLHSHFLDYYYVDESAIFNTDQNIININIDRKHNTAGNTIFKHFNFENELSLLNIELELDKGDISNLKTIYFKREQLKQTSLKYIRNSNFVDMINNFNETKIDNLPAVCFKFDISNDKSSGQLNFKLKNEIKNDEILLVYTYLKDYNQIQTLLELSNAYENTNYPVLNSPFAMISSMRQYSNFTDGVHIGTGLYSQIKQADQGEGGLSAKNYHNSDYIFRINSLKIGQFIRRERDKFGIEKALFLLENSNNFYSKINKKLEQFLGIRFRLENYNKSNDSFSLRLYKQSKQINFYELSMGQKSILFLIFAIYCYDINSGLLVIDEPELHLHASMQKIYLKILKEASDNDNLQIIMATHSGIFIDESTIRNTYRFQNILDHSNITNPNSINQKQKDLLKILTYTDSSRIFFADKVILVEGDTDEYFYNYFYENHIKKQNLKDISIEILYIGGKGNYNKWNEFLKLFSIDTYFICDFDNIKEFKILEDLNLSHEKVIENSKKYIISKFTDEKIAKKSTKDGKELLNKLDRIINNGFEIDEKNKMDLKSLWVYSTEKQGLKHNHLIKYLKENNKLDILENINQKIESLYSEKIFILKQGELEDYLNISKDLENVIKFCQNEFNNWIETENREDNNYKIRELENIFFNIIKSN